MAEDTTPPDDSNEDSGLVKNLRQQIKERDERISGLTEDIRTYVLRDAGFDADPDSEGYGPTKALLKLHDGDLSVEAIKATAAEYGIKPPGDSDDGDEPTQPGPVDEVEQQRRDAQQRVGQLRSETSSVPAGSPSLDQQIADAEQAKDWTRVMELNTVKLAKASSSA